MAVVIPNPAEGRMSLYTVMSAPPSRSNPPEVKPYITAVRNSIQAAIPEAEERISWSMPTYWKEHNILHFAASKKHIGLYPGPAAVEQFSKELQGYKTDKGTIRIPYGKVDSALIEKIAKWCLETGNHA